MYASNVFIVSALALASTVQGAPLTKRIAQVIADSTAKWEAACVSFLLSLARLPFLCVRLLVQFHSDEAKFISLSHGEWVRERAAPCNSAVYNHHIVFVLIQHQIPSVSSICFWFCIRLTLRLVHSTDSCRRRASMQPALCHRIHHAPGRRRTVRAARCSRQHDRPRTPAEQQCRHDTFCTALRTAATQLSDLAICTILPDCPSKLRAQWAIPMPV